MDERIKELTLLLLYLTVWEENEDEKYLRSWKGYDFDILNELSEKGLISDSKRSKSTYLTEKGVKLAKKLEEKYFGLK